MIKSERILFSILSYFLTIAVYGFVFDLGKFFFFSIDVFNDFAAWTVGIIAMFAALSSFYYSMQFDKLRSGQKVIAMIAAIIALPFAGAWVTEQIVERTEDLEILMEWQWSGSITSALFKVVLIGYLIFQSGVWKMKSGEGKALEEKG
ncbi:MAG: hypothetical protein HWD92_00910 [Flavobacteriia bacterium]|nr:hypothetical protein [Flavobacteriia bacterium]